MNRHRFLNINERWKKNEYQIDVILVLNLEHRPDRFYMVYAGLDIADAPLDRVKRWNAVPGSKFKSLQEIVEATAEDGFPKFQLYCLSEENCSDRYEDELQFHINVMTQKWSYCQMLRYLRDTNQSGLILYDDRYVRSWLHLADTYHYLREAQLGNDTLILQLEYYENIWCQRYDRIRHPSVPYIVEGPISSSENAMVYSPEGAAFLLEYLFINSELFVESTIGHLSHQPREKIPYFWSYDVDIVGWFDTGTNIRPEASDFNKIIDIE